MLTIASRNSHKVKELKEQLNNLGITDLSYHHINMPTENGLSFIENALIKARHVAKHTQTAVIADDSGLVVKALESQPGIHSARYAGDGATDAQNYQKLLKNMKGIGDQSAQFVCVLVYLRNAKDPLPVIAQGIWKGEITQNPEGENGFGYDPVFYLPSYQCTAANLTTAIKNKISHRAKAVDSLIQKIRTNAE